MKLDFSTSAGACQIERTGSNLTPLGGLIAFASFVNELGVLDTLSEEFPVTRKSNNALPTRDILVGFMLTALLDGDRFSDIRYIQNDPVVGEAFGVKKRIPGDDTVRRLFERVEPDAGRDLMYRTNQYLYQNLPDYYILDWDSTITTRYGAQEGVKIGYNPGKPGRGSHHPLVCSAAGVRLCLDVEMRPGNAHTAAGWIENMENLFAQLPENKQPWLNRADVGFCGEKFLRWHEESHKRPHYLFKLKQTQRVKEAIAEVPEDAWEGNASINALQLAECELKLSSWDTARRVVVGRR
ncbi:transposase, partial [Chitinivibrio alkaliphilus]|uniref:transposase n=1 Tax=Chitinivibrio alkaliphilus TaxID=1505232 RepID=UPI0012DE8F1F